MTSRRQTLGKVVASLKLDQAIARQGRLGRDPRRVHEIVRDIAFDIRVFGRHAVHRHDHVEAAQCRFVAGMQHRAVRRRAGHDHGLDAMVLEDLLEIGVEEFVRAGLYRRLAALRRHLRQRIGQRAAVDVAIDHQHVMGARLGQEFLGRRQRRDAARPALHVAALLDEIQQQQRRGLGIDRDRFQRRCRRRLDRRPVVDDGLLGARGRGDGDEGGERGGKRKREFHGGSYLVDYSHSIMLGGLDVTS